MQVAEAGELENHYLTTYGSVVRWNGPLGVRGASILPRLRFLTGDTDRKIVCGLPIPRQPPISCVLDTYGPRPPLPVR
jgi:hypothetical protein